MKGLKGTYFGNEEVKTVVDGIILSRYNYMLDATPWHYHSNPYFMFVLEGNMKDTNRQRESLCPAGSLMYNNWDEPHFGSKHSTHASGFHLEIERTYLTECDLNLDRVEGSQQIVNPKLHFLFLKLYREFCISGVEHNLSIASLTFQILDIMQGGYETSTKMPPWVNDIKEILHDHPGEVTLKSLSLELGVHPVHISRMASKYLACNLGEYRRMVKVKKAVPHLMTGSKSLTEIAYDCGFSDHSHFTRVFKRYLAMTPSSFKKQWNDYK